MVFTPEMCLTKKCDKKVDIGRSEGQIIILNTRKYCIFKNKCFLKYIYLYIYNILVEYINRTISRYIPNRKIAVTQDRAHRDFCTIYLFIFFKKRYVHDTLTCASANVNKDEQVNVLSSRM